ncbi:hypothetical protein BZG36_04319 [Bifiguratus adelaidae]|uniref:RNA polymerase II assembly factor Rtp1 C-terminal domain-containing protein n=1 Tax=Bifiguratus adelaidae TaxID=1938954 RepID=A0A261XUX9_9FUNG|nr:hypothetical protein BZG36_04319 [Bifiguratus adelaidae]
MSAVNDFRGDIDRLIGQAEGLVGKRTVELGHPTLAQGLEERLQKYTLERDKDKDAYNALQQFQQLSVSAEGTEQRYNDSERLANVKVRFVDACLQLLEDFQHVLVNQSAVDQPDGKSPLGVRDIRLVSTLIEIVISWGILPYLIPGVGMDLAHRSKSGYVDYDIIQGQEGKTQSTIAEPRRLQAVLNTLLSLLPDNFADSAYTHISHILINRNLMDIYAALLQLAYGPRLKISNEGEQVTSARDLTDEERAQSSNKLERCFEKIEPIRNLEVFTQLLGNKDKAPAPKWLRVSCGRYLTRILLGPEGIRLVLEFMVGQHEDVTTPDLEKVTKLILSVPQQVESAETYFSNVCSQLLSILASYVQSQPNAPSSISTRHPSVRTAVVYIVNRMAEIHARHSEKFIKRPLTDALLDWPYKSKDMPSQVSNFIGTVHGTVVRSEQELSLAILQMHALLVDTYALPQLFAQLVKPTFSTLYHLYKFSDTSKTHIARPTLEILHAYILQAEYKEIVLMLRSVAITSDVSYASTTSTQWTCFGAGDEGGVNIRTCSHEEAENQYSFDVLGFVDFLKTIQNSSLLGDFFLHMLAEYSSLEKEGSRTFSPMQMVSILNLILTMLDKLGPEIFQNTTQIIMFAHGVIEAYAEARRQPSMAEASAGNKSTDYQHIVDKRPESTLEDDLESLQENTEMLFLAMNLLSTLLQEHESFSAQEAQVLRAIASNLVTLFEYPAPEISGMARGLKIAIANQQASAQARNEQDEQAHSSLQTYQEALKAIQDNLLPVRAHGIGMLKEMVLAKDPLVTDGAGLDHVLDLFTQLVQDEDSFIYLNAVKGLSALTDIHGNRIIHKLATFYADATQHLDNRLRVGEALLQTVQRAGDALSKYADELLRPLTKVLSSTKEPSPMRASALSILGTACETCPIGIYSHLHDIVDLTLAILDLDQTTEVRRAATVLIASLIGGLNQQTLFDFPSDLLKATYRRLKFIEETDLDELTRQHARTTLADLDTIVRGQLFKEQYAQNKPGIIELD